MLTIRFDAKDLSRTCLSTTADPFLETMLGAELLRHRAAGLVFRPWRLGLRGLLDRRVQPLARLIPRHRRGLDLPTLVGPVTDIAEGRQRLGGVPRPDLRRELVSLTGSGCGRPLSRLCDPQGMREELGQAITVFHGMAIEPHWARIQHLMAADRAARLRVMGRFGVGRLLTSLCPAWIRWREPVLEVGTPSDHDGQLHLDGRGILLVPSVFVGEKPYLAVNLVDETARPQLVYPVLRDLADAGAVWSARTDRKLGDLLGRTRCAVLHAAAHGHGTREIARRLEGSAATVSQHLAVLRAAGLLTARRDGARVEHLLTTAGEALLES